MSHVLRNRNRICSHLTSRIHESRNLTKLSQRRGQSRRYRASPRGSGAAVCGRTTAADCMPRIRLASDTRQPCPRRLLCHEALWSGVTRNVAEECQFVRIRSRSGEGNPGGFVALEAEFQRLAIPIYRPCFTWAVGRSMQQSDSAFCEQHLFCIGRRETRNEVSPFLHDRRRMRKSSSAKQIALAMLLSRSRTWRWLTPK